jgi:gluconolactonase
MPARDETTTVRNIRQITDGLAFPEGPVALPDGSVLVVEIRAERLTRVRPDGRKETVAAIPGGPNGAQIGPDGRCYICNNGGFAWREISGYGQFPVGTPEGYRTGSIDVVDLGTGRVERLYDRAGEEPLGGPNDLVFDHHGGFWFSDPGKMGRRDTGNTAVFYARADGSFIERKISHLASSNGVALSADETRLYVIEALTARLWVFDLDGPGSIRAAPFPSPHGGRYVGSGAGFTRFDSMALDSAENACIGTLFDNCGITVISPDGKRVETIGLPDPLTTNICFGGPDLRTAFVTMSATGRLFAMEWPRPGLKLNYLNP